MPQWDSPRKLQRLRSRVWLYKLGALRSSGYLGTYLPLKGIKQKAPEGDAETPADFIYINDEVHFKSVAAFVFGKAFSQNFNF